MEALIVIFVIIAHFTVGGYSYQSIQNYSRPRCTYHGTVNCDGDCGHSVLAGLSVLLWPVIGPLLLGQSLAGKDGKKPTRDDKRRAKEIEEAQHKAKIAKLKADEHEALDRELSLIERQRELERV